MESERREGTPGISRLEALSDGVMAIALTLLVLELRVPVAGATRSVSAAGLAAALGKDSGEITSYVISFFVITQFWMAHHWVMRRVSGHEESLAWWNFGFLFTITAMPFTSNLLGSYGGNPLAVDIFAVNLLLATLSLQGILLAARRGAVLGKQAVTRDGRAGHARAAIIAVVISVSIGLAWVSTSAAQWCWLLIAAAPWLATRLSGHHGNHEARA